MVVCKFWLENRCRNGNNCRFEHTQNGSSQKGLFSTNSSWQDGGGGGGGQRVSFQQNTPNNNRYKWVAPHLQSQGQAQQQDSSQRSALDLVNTLPEEMTTWEKSKMWHLSCISVEKDLPSLPDFQDFSMEEMRLEAYQAKAQGNMSSYIQKVNTLASEYQNKRDQLKRMSMDLKNKLMAFIEDSRLKKSSEQSGSSMMDGMNQTTSSAFSSSGSTGGAGQSLFGKPQASAPNLFGSSVFGNSSTPQGSGSQPSLFGGGGGSTPQGSVFGGNQAAPQQGSVFGGASAGSGGSLFGKPVQDSNSVFGGGQKPSLLGPIPGTFPTSGSTPGLFSAQPTPGLFGKGGTSQPSSAAPNLFGKGGGSTPFGGGAGGSSLLGNPPSSTTTAPSLFGNQQQQQQQGLFGSGPASSGFGQPQNSSFGGFSPAQPGSSVGGGLFGKGPATPGISGAAQRGASGVNDTATLYTPLAELTAAEKAAFEAKDFELGKIPLRPPPKELCS